MGASRSHMHDGTVSSTHCEVAHRVAHYDLPVSDCDKGYATIAADPQSRPNQGLISKISKYVRHRTKQRSRTLRWRRTARVNDAQAALRNLP